MFRTAERQGGMTTPALWKWLVAGVLATLTMDLAAALFRKVGLTAGVSPELIGRWLASLARGQLTHQTIAQTAPFKGELPLGLAGHYLIGITLTVLFWALVFKGPLRDAGLAPVGVALAAVGFGALTNALPWLWMFPSMGFGFFGLDGSPEALLLRSSFLNHLAFGAGLALVTRIFGGTEP